MVMRKIIDFIYTGHILNLTQTMAREILILCKVRYENFDNKLLNIRQHIFPILYSIVQLKRQRGFQLIL